MQCPSCGTDNHENAAYCIVCGNPLGNTVFDGESGSDLEKQDTGTKTKPKSSLLWMILSAVLLVAAAALGILYVQKSGDYDTLSQSYDRLQADYQTLEAERQTLNSDQESLDQQYRSLQSEYDALVEAYNLLMTEASALSDQYDMLVSECDTLQTEYDQLRELMDLYGVEGRYAVTLTDAYNSDTDYNRIGDTLEAAALDCLCVKFEISDVTGAWADTVVYADILNPDGSVFMPKSENNGHTWTFDLSGAKTTIQACSGWWRDDWQTGIYRVVFYQGDTAIASFSINVV